MSTSVRIQLDAGAMARMLKSPGGAVGRHMLVLANRTLDNARKMAPVKSGDLKASLGVTEVTQGQRGTMVRLGANISYGMDVHAGTKPHVIVPKNKSVLRFPNKAGTIVYARKVNHPGTKPNPYLWQALVDAIR